MYSAPGTFFPWSVQSTRVLPRPWSVVIKSEVLSLYRGSACTHAHSSATYRSAVQELQDRQVRVGLLAVGVDPRVGEPAEHLAVAGIGELEPVGALRRGLLAGVAEHLPLLRDRPPEERHERVAARLDGLAQV